MVGEVSVSKAITSTIPLDHASMSNDSSLISVGGVMTAVLFVDSEIVLSIDLVISTIVFLQTKAQGLSGGRVQA